MQNSSEAKEPWEEYCQRRIREAQDSIRLYRGMTAVIPLLRARPEVVEIDSVLSAMEGLNHADAREELVRWITKNWVTDSVAPILRAFDTHST